MADIQEQLNDEYWDNYSVEAERAGSIRERVQQLKELEVMDNLKLLAKELGEELSAKEDGETLDLPGLSTKGENPLVFSAPVGHPAEGLRVALQNTDLKVYAKESLILELTFLPKDGEFVVYFMDEEKLTDLSSWVASLKEFTDAAKAKKKERQAKWAKRFKKK